MNNELPYRFRETTFRDYEKIIAMIVNEWPICLKWWPCHYNKAQATFAGRLRDSMESYKQHDWPSLMIDRPKFLIIWPSGKNPVIVSERSDGSVLTGTPQTIKAYLNTSSNNVPLSYDTSTMPNNDFIWDLLVPAEVNLALASMAKKLAPRLLLSGLTDKKAEELQKQYDIALEKQDKNWILI
jgi:hypothetical protein